MPLALAGVNRSSTAGGTNTRCRYCKHGVCNHLGDDYDGKFKCECDEGWTGSPTCNESVSGRECHENELKVGSNCQDCAQGGRSDGAACVYAGKCARGCTCKFSPETGLSPDAKLIVTCDGLQPNNDSWRLPLATAVLDLRAMGSFSPASLSLPKTLVAWRADYLNEMPENAAFRVKKPPQELYVRLPTPVDTAITPLTATSSAIGLAAPSVTVAVSCGDLSEASMEDGALQMSLCDGCQPCRAGSYSDMSGQCQACAAGAFYQNQQGKVGISSECGCKSCAPGTFTAEAGANKSTDCQKCPAGTIGEFAAGYRACRCQANHARENRFGPCTSCANSPGLYCASDVRQLAPGYWWKFASERDEEMYLALAANLAVERGYMLEQAYTNITIGARRRRELGSAISPTNVTVYSGHLPAPHKCPNEAACAGGLDSRCTEGYSGTLCGVCLPGYTMLYGDCIGCGPYFGTIAIVAVISVAAVILAAFFWRSNSNVALSVADGQPATKWQLAMNKIMILIGFIQVLSATGASFPGVRWPENFLALTSKLQVITLDLFALASPSCLLPGSEFGFYENFLFALLFPLCLIVVIGLLYQARRLLSPPGNWENWKAVCTRNALFVLFLFYPGTSQAVCRMLQPCVSVCSFDGQEDCDEFLPSDYSIKCGSAKHQTFVILAGVFGVVCFVVAIPVALLVYLRRNKPAVRRVQEAIADEVQANSADLSPLIRATSAFFEAYTSQGQAYLWGVVDLLRKLFLTSIILVITDADSYTQIIIGVAASFFFVWLTEHTRPFIDKVRWYGRSIRMIHGVGAMDLLELTLPVNVGASFKEDHILQQLTDFTIALNMIVGMGVRALDHEGGVSKRSLEEIESDRNGIGVFLIIANVTIMIVTVWQAVALRFPQASLLAGVLSLWRWLNERLTCFGQRVGLCLPASKSGKTAHESGTATDSVQMQSLGIMLENPAYDGRNDQLGHEYLKKEQAEETANFDFDVKPIVSDGKETSSAPAKDTVADLPVVSWAYINPEKGQC